MNIITKYIKTLSESLKDNKKLIVICFALFLIVAIGIYFLGHQRFASHASEFKALIESNPNNYVQHTSTLSLFVHNSFAVVYSYIGGIIFGIVPFFTLLYNSFALGSQFAAFEVVRPNGFLEYLLYVIPHGIFEIPGSILGSVSGFVLFKFVWRFLKGLKQSDANAFTERLSESYQNNKHVLIQSLALFIFAIILMMIAAPIEGNISLPFSKFILHY